MIGFHATVTGELQLDRCELEDARWFTRDELRAAVGRGTVVLPTRVSISYRLIEDWLNGDAG